MKNLEQIRAANALSYASKATNTRGTQGGEVVKKLPALIMTNGLLAAGAFAFAKGEEDGWYVCFNHLAAHLADRETGVLPPGCGTLVKLLEHLTKEADSGVLQRSTAESLAWLAFAKRFVRKGRAGGDGGGDDTY
jgi:CRISPR/Cas system CMR-associated protein Cmr5 small subunit